MNDVMRPLGDVQSVTPEHTAADAFELMARDDLNQLPVVDRGNLLGVVSRGHIFRLLQQRAALAS